MIGGVFIFIGFFKYITHFWLESKRYADAKRQHSSCNFAISPVRLTKMGGIGFRLRPVGCG